MTTLDLELRVEQLIDNSDRITINQIVNEFKEISEDLRSCIRSIVSQLIVKKNLKTEFVNGRLFVTNKSALDKTSQVKSIKRSNGDVDTISPKCVPADGDWIVYLRGDDKDHIYVDKKFNRTDARLLYSKLNKVDYKKVNIKMYHKKDVLIVAPYQWD